MRRTTAFERLPSAAQIRRIAHQLQADLVLVITEAWTLPPEQMPRYEAILAEHGSISASPLSRRQRLLRVGDGPGMWAAQMPLQESNQAPGARTFATPRLAELHRDDLPALTPGKPHHCGADQFSTRRRVSYDRQSVTVV